MKAFFADGPISGRLFWRLCLVLCIVGLALRLPTLASRSLWLDEGYSAWFSALPLHELWTTVPLYETHPPVFYSLLKGWTHVFGNSEAALRSMSVLASVATILLVAVSGKVLRIGPVGDRIGLLAALLLAVNRGSIEYAQQARPYAIETLIASASILFSLILLKRLTSNDVDERRWPALWPSVIGLGACAGATLWLHNTAVFIVFGIWTGMIVSLLLFGRGPRLQQALVCGISGGLALLIWSPFLPLFLHASASMSKMSFWVTMHRNDVFSAWVLATGGTFPVIPVLALCLVGAVILWRIQRAVITHLCIVLILPLVVMLAYSFLVRPVYINRLFEWMAPSVMVLAAIGIWAGIKKPFWRSGATVVVVALCLVSTVSFYGKSTENWRALIGTVAADAQPGDAVIVYPNELNVVLNYYALPQRTFPEIFYVPAPFPALGRNATYIGNLGAPAIQANDATQVSAIAASHHRIWLITRGSGLYDHNNVVRNTLTKQMTRVRNFHSESSQVELFQ